MAESSTNNSSGEKAQKYIMDTICIDGELHELLVKTDGENTEVAYNGKAVTLTEALASIL